MRRKQSKSRWHWFPQLAEEKVTFVCAITRSSCHFFQVLFQFVVHWYSFTMCLLHMYHVAANSLALYGTPLFDPKLLKELLPSTGAPDTDFHCVTIVSGKLTFCADAFRLKLKKRINFESDETPTTSTASESAPITDEIQTEVDEVLYEQFHEDVLNEAAWLKHLRAIRSIINKVTKQIKDGEIHLMECKYFEIEAPFPLLGQYNMSILDIPGLSTIHEDIVNSAIETGKEANVVCLVGGLEARGIIEQKDFNMLETFVNRDIGEVPPVIYIDNVSRRLNEMKATMSEAEVQKKKVNDEQVHSVFLNFVAQNRTNIKILPNIQGYRRNAIIDKMLKSSFGFAFYGPGHEHPFSRLVSPQQDCFCTIELCRRHNERRILQQSKYNALSCVITMQSNLRNRKINMTEEVTKDQVKKAIRRFKRDIVKPKDIQDRYEKVCARIMNDLNSKITSTRVPNLKFWRHRLEAILSRDTYFDIVDAFLSYYQESCLTILREQLIDIFDLSDEYEFSDEESLLQYDDVTAIQNEGSHLLQPQDMIYKKVKDDLEQLVDDQVEALRSKQVMPEVEDKMINILKRNVAQAEKLDFTLPRGLSLSKQKVYAIIRLILCHLTNRRWSESTKKTLMRSLFTHDALIETMCESFNEIATGPVFDKAKAVKLQGQISKWKNSDKESKAKGFDWL